MNVLHGREILLYGTVGKDWCDDGFDSMDVIAALAEIGPDAPVTVRINSGGGFVFEGLAIYSALAAHRGAVTCVVDASACSAASIIAMAGDEVVMRLGAMMMIHDPSTITWDDAEGHRAAAVMLDKIGASMAAIYAARTGRPVEECRAEMIAETWLTAEDAVAGGYADRIGLVAATDAPAGTPDLETENEDDEGEDESDGEPMSPTAFDYRVYMHAPEALRTIASAAGWTNRRPLAAIATNPAAVSPKEAPTMSRNPAPPAPSTAASDPAAHARADAAEVARICAEAGEHGLVAALISSGATAAVARDRIAAAKDIRAAVEAARRQAPEIEASIADRAIAAGTSIDGVRADLFARITAADAAAPRTETGFQPGPIGGAGHPQAIDVSAIYAAHNKAIGTPA